MGWCAITSYMEGVGEIQKMERALGDRVIGEDLVELVLKMDT